MAIVPRKKSDGSTSYQVKVKVADSGWITETFQDRLKAVEFELMAKRKVQRGTALELQDGLKATVGELTAVYFEETRHDVSEGWRISQEQMYRDYIHPVIGDLKVAKVKEAHVKSVINNALDEGLSQQMALHIYSLMNSVFKYAARVYKMIDENPVNSELHRPSVPKTKRAFLEPEQSKILLRGALNHQWLGPPIAVELLAGLRTEAMIGLKPDAILWGSSQIVIKRAWKQKIGVMADYPKTENWEYVPMIQPLAKYLRLILGPEPDPDRFVCPGPKGGQLSYETFEDAVPRLCKKLGLPRITPHELRHSCTELWIQEGATQEDIRRLLNHKNTASTAGYIHRTEGRLREIGARVGLSLVGSEKESFPKSFPNGKQTADANDA